MTTTATQRYSRNEKERLFAFIDRRAATEVRVHPNTGYRWIRQAGLATRRMSLRVDLEAAKTEFFRLQAESGNNSGVARELGFTGVTCYQ